MMMMHRRAPEFYVFGDPKLALFGDCLSHCFKQNNTRVETVGDIKIISGLLFWFSRLKV